MASADERCAATNAELLSLMQAIAVANASRVDALLGASPRLPLAALRTVAFGASAAPYFLTAIRHQVYAGDTALHVAAASHRPEIVDRLLVRGADVRARNRRGAEPLHYAADGVPAEPAWNPDGQHDVIERLLAAGADPNALDRSGVSPLHRAVRTRCAAAVGALLAGGADVRRQNGSGSTPLHLAVQTTGRGGSGTPAAREQQRAIILLLQEHGARATDRGGAGHAVRERATTDWVRTLLG